MVRERGLVMLMLDEAGLRRVPKALLFRFESKTTWWRIESAALGLRVVLDDHRLVESDALGDLVLADVGGADLEVEVVGELLHRFVDECAPLLRIHLVVISLEVYSKVEGKELLQLLGQSTKVILRQLVGVVLEVVQDAESVCSRLLQLHEAIDPVVGDDAIDSLQEDVLELALPPDHVQLALVVLDPVEADVLELEKQPLILLNNFKLLVL